MCLRARNGAFFIRCALPLYQIWVLLPQKWKRRHPGRSTPPFFALAAAYCGHEVS
jgi:hypothetical protein